MTRVEQIELMNECWNDAKKVGRFSIQSMIAVAFFEYRTQQHTEVE